MTNTLIWFRRDLRAFDNAALYHALKEATIKGASVYAVFVFDTEILQSLPRVDRRVEFIRESLMDVDAQLQKLSNGKTRLMVLHGKAAEEIPRLATRWACKRCMPITTMSQMLWLEMRA